MASEPSLKTGAFIASLGLVVIITGLLLQQESEVTSFLLSLSPTLYGDVGPGLASFGIGWVIASLNPLKKFYLITIVLGVAAAAVTIFLSSPLIEMGYLWAIAWHALIFSVAPALVCSGVVSGVIVEKHLRKHGLPRAEVPFEKYLLAIISALLFLFVSSPSALLRLIASAIASWTLWHIISHRLAFHLLKRNLEKSAGRLKLIFTGRVESEELSFGRVFSRVYYPLAFGIGASLTALSIVELLPQLGELLPTDPLAKTAQVALIAIIAVTMGSSYVGPVVWMYQDSGLRIRDNRRMTVEEPKIHNLANNLIEVYSFIQAPISFTIVSTGGDYLYALALLALLIVSVLTVSLSATLLYLKFSADSHLYYLINSLFKSGYIEPPKPHNTGEAGETRS